MRLTARTMSAPPVFLACIILAASFGAACRENRPIGTVTNGGAGGQAGRGGAAGGNAGNGGSGGGAAGTGGAAGIGVAGTSGLGGIRAAGGAVGGAGGSGVAGGGGAGAAGGGGIGGGGGGATGGAGGSDGGGGGKGGGSAGGSAGAAGGSGGSAAILLECPATPPSGACSTAFLTCAYPTQSCLCENGVWTCAACPATRPAIASGYGGDPRMSWACVYDDVTCTAPSYLADGAHIAMYWSCGVCPAAHPSTGGICQTSQSYECRYGLDTCLCAGRWTCATPTCGGNPVAPAAVNQCAGPAHYTCAYPDFDQTCICGAYYGRRCSCPATLPASGSSCLGFGTGASFSTMSGPACSYGATTCTCKNTTWSCTVPL